MPFRSVSQKQYFFFEVETHDEVETGIAPIDDLVAAVFNERAKRLIARETFSHEFALKSGPFLDCHLVVVLCQSRLALLVHHQQEFYHRIIIIHKHHHQTSKTYISTSIIIKKE